VEYLVSTNLNILNKGNEPTFVISNRKEVIDLTLGTDKIGDLVTNWHISDKITFCTFATRSPSLNDSFMPHF
jgi:hypothetical protein